MADTFTTKDYNEISLLLAHNFRVASIRREEAVFFSFEPREKALALTEAFWRGDLKMNLRDFVNGQRLAKDQIFRAMRQGAS